MKTAILYVGSIGACLLGFALIVAGFSILELPGQRIGGLVSIFVLAPTAFALTVVFQHVREQLKKEGNATRKE